MAGLNSYGKTTILEETISRDHTENILLKNTKAIKIKKGKKERNHNFWKEKFKTYRIRY